MAGLPHDPEWSQGDRRWEANLRHACLLCLSETVKGAAEGASRDMMAKSISHADRGIECLRQIIPDTPPATEADKDVRQRYQDDIRLLADTLGWKNVAHAVRLELHEALDAINESLALVPNPALRKSRAMLIESMKRGKGVAKRTQKR
ncbi:hypothetical protein KIPB_011231 [Kipferlia bialata]|uniref:Uncharacterized protein n=1 Tax=Kipferlia bialata TaxID=797122 RepID=A0A9K3D687_9EUKA|nr:hypothetical protein KIPB_011231 [Kipferlia bialata]|eukprot:g11231.t1